MSTVTLVSRAGLVADIPQADFDKLLLQIGPVRARERILSDAGRALKHRRELAAHYAQTLTEADLANINQMARAFIRREAIERAAYDLGYGSTIDRVNRGGRVDEISYGRIVSRATEWAGNIDDTPDDGALCYAAEQLGFTTERTADWDRNWLRPTWKITAPDGWNQQPAETPTALA